MAFLTLLGISAFGADRNRNALMQADRDFAKATADKGVDGWMAYMAPNAVDLTAEPLVGLDQIRASMTKQFKLPRMRMRWVPIRAELLDNGDVGYTVGRYEVSYLNEEGKPTGRRGSYLTTWQKQKDGSWKVISDIGAPDKER